MADISHVAGVGRERGRRAELWQFRALVAATYPLFLATTLARRAGGAAGPKPASGRRSLFVEAYAAASASLACAFMG
jgi:hypothetical protein